MSLIKWFLTPKHTKTTLMSRILSVQNFVTFIITCMIFIVRFGHHKSQNVYQLSLQKKKIQRNLDLQSSAGSKRDPISIKMRNDLNFKPQMKSLPPSGKKKGKNKTYPVTRTITQARIRALQLTRSQSAETANRR